MPPPNFDGTETVVHNGHAFYAEQRVVTTTVNLNRRQYASITAKFTGPVIPANSRVNVIGWCRGDEVDGENRWWIGDGGSRLWAGGTKEKPNS